MRVKLFNFKRCALGKLYGSKVRQSLSNGVGCQSQSCSMTKQLGTNKLGKVAKQTEHLPSNVEAEA